MMARMPERLLGARKDNSPCICGAVKYVFSFRRMEWVATSTNVRVLTPLKAAAKGGMRVCYDVEEVEEDGSRTPCVAKLFLRNISDVVEKDYFSEGEAQCMCEQFANNFNKATFTGIERPHVSFLQCQVLRIPKQNIPAEHRDAQHGFFSYKTTDTREVMFVMEPRLHGHFTKYNSNFGETYEGDKHFKTPSQIQQRTRMFLIAEAFSHFTLAESGGSMLLCDLQGVNDLFTDPQIHTEDGKGLGLGNMGHEGIEKFVLRHECNEFCRAFALKPLDGIRPPNGKESRTNNFYVRLRAQLQQDMVPLSKPIGEMTEEEQIAHAIRLSQISH
ncbi:myosin heavy chain kinase A [Trypanosoma cruzi cruzi]|uniref:Putative myosin heavy chain kinase A n=1 Tax=Trypanosoma cruzi TaxID=5693 RepID=A0A2V2UJB7_TRYCR|nr:myosin heavy chain kinase A [Trypanosoma cruzi cruzi]PWU83296.1 putative myosin heavy chain kinase A [Trypanosoma cruzi]PBJ74632.1 myosin heavy chain kinase A [Trypanosoma cruzi cruzi]PBJ74640.1 myosin heavy chain kinase A [Trypanosoma cruzi cruzi]PBJ81402.1 myosin heavy chain kinase A [Trypanosoma cruzi cruzi]